MQILKNKNKKYLTLSEVVEAVRHAWAPSYLPTVTRAGKIFWLRFKVNTGTNIVHTLYIWKKVNDIFNNISISILNFSNAV